MHWRAKQSSVPAASSQKSVGSVLTPFARLSNCAVSFAAPALFAAPLAQKDEATLPAQTTAVTTAAAGDESGG